MLDTDTVSYAVRGVGRVAAHLARQRPSTVCISSLTLAELRFGAERKGSARLHSNIDEVVAALFVAPFDAVAADQFGQTYARLALAGMPIGQVDALIAAHALALDLTLVTNNERHFTRVPGLTIENWV